MAGSMEERTARQTILIVDDEPANIRILVELLRDDYHLRTTTSGEKAVAIVQSNDPPDLVLLDIMMPDMDGFEVCRALKQDPLTNPIPIIFITSRAQEQDEVIGFQTGAVDYIVKPFSPVIVRARIKTHAELSCLRKKLEYQSYCDGLTGIANRRQLDMSLNRCWDFALREGIPLSCIMIDLDHFKQFNDLHGHLAGDDCLRRVATALKGELHRHTDIVGRYGGEEFCCLLPGTDQNGVRQIADKFQTAIQTLDIRHAGNSAAPYVTISQGVATCFPHFSLKAESLLITADKALYAAKIAGRNRIETEPDMLLNR